MVIVLVKWKIKPGREAEAQAHWEQKLTIGDRSGLVGEFLCEPGSEPYITWGFTDPDDPPCTVFLNAAIWADAEAFRKQVEPYFKDDKEPEPFEAARRVRTVLYPKSRRIGASGVPGGDSEGVR